MKKIKTFKLFESNRKEYVVRSSSPSPTGPWTDPSEVFNITCIESITVENGTPSGLKFVAGEDTGGEYAYLVIDGYTPNMDGDSFEPLIQGDVISFDESEKDVDKVSKLFVVIKALTITSIF